MKKVLGALSVAAAMLLTTALPAAASDYQRVAQLNGPNQADALTNSAVSTGQRVVRTEVERSAIVANVLAGTDAYICIYKAKMSGTEVDDTHVVWTSSVHNTCSNNVARITFEGDIRLKDGSKWYASWSEEDVNCNEGYYCNRAYIQVDKVPGNVIQP